MGKSTVMKGIFIRLFYIGIIWTRLGWSKV